MSRIPVERYSTAGRPAGQRLAYWNDLASETFNNLAIDAERPEDFHGRMVRAPLGELTLMSADSAPARVRRLNDPARTARGLRAVDLHFQVSGRSLNSQGGREAQLEAGDFTLCDASQPYSVRFPEANHMLCVKIPTPALSQRLGDLDRLLCAPVSGRSGPGAMLSGFLRTLWTQIDEEEDVGSAEALSEVVLDLIGLAYRPLCEGRATAQAEWLRRARSLIDDRICEPELGVSAIAEALGVSSRYVQMLFAADATTPSAYILDRRLRLAAERLRRADGLGVTEVAMAVGFNDLTHFGRAFRRRFGVTPRDYRDGRRAPRWQGRLAPLDERLRQPSPQTV
jgi:AraC-like DNA-binding protein